MKPLRLYASLALVALLSGGLRPPLACAADAPVVLEGKDGPGKGKHVVLISGDQEYRSEETIPQLAKILATRHGFKCTVLFTVDEKTGTINPNVNNIPGLDALKTADLMVIFTRFLNLPDDQMQHIALYLATGKPVVGLRTSTHAFNIPKDRKFAKFSYNSGDPNYKQGFGKQVLGETWVAHHGAHGKEGTRGRIAKGQEKHPILKGIKDGEIFGTTDVYTVNLPLPGDSTPLVLGEVTETLKPDSKAVAGKKNDPMMPVAWTRTYAGELADSATARVFATTMGASQDFESEATRRMIVNGCYWAVGLEDKIPDKSNVEIVGEFKPTPFRFKKNEDWKPGVKPADLFK
jgi:type 1 glutamine amidotransferase